MQPGHKGRPLQFGKTVLIKCDSWILCLFFLKKLQLSWLWERHTPPPPPPPPPHTHTHTIPSSVAPLSRRCPPQCCLGPLLDKHIHSWWALSLIWSFHLLGGGGGLTHVCQVFHRGLMFVSFNYSYTLAQHIQYLKWYKFHYSKVCYYKHWNGLYEEVRLSKNDLCG